MCDYLNSGLGKNSKNGQIWPWTWLKIISDCTHGTDLSRDMGWDKVIFLLQPGLQCRDKYLVYDPRASNGYCISPLGGLQHCRVRTPPQSQMLWRHCVLWRSTHTLGTTQLGLPIRLGFDLGLGASVINPDLERLRISAWITNKIMELLDFVGSPTYSIWP